MSTKHIRLTGSSKFKQHFVGPFTVLWPVGSVAYKLDLTGRFKQLHNVFQVSQLAPFVGNGPGELLLPVLVEGKEEFEAD